MGFKDGRRGIEKSSTKFVDVVELKAGDSVLPWMDGCFNRTAEQYEFGLPAKMHTLRLDAILAELMPMIPM